MAYTKTNWVDDTAPYINAANLNKIEQGIEDAHNGVLATQLTGLIPINGTPLPSDSLLVAIGKLKNTADNPSSGALESFDVPISSGWQANLDETPSALQTFRKKSGVVVSNGLYLVQTPLTAGTVIATLPVALRPSYRVKGVAFAQLAGKNTFSLGLFADKNTFSPVPFYIETNGQFGILFAPPTEFSLILETTYFV